MRILLSSIILLLTFCLPACKKEGDKPEVSGRFTHYVSCSVVAPPESVGLDTFYKFYLNCSGVPVVAPAGVPQEALYAADSIIAFMLDSLDDVRHELMRQGVYHVLYPVGMTPNDLPEKQGEPFSYGPGSFIPHKQLSISSVANILCYPAPDNRSGQDCEMMHEFAHLFHQLGLAKVHDGFDAELDALYQQALASGIWDSTILTYDALHYFEEGVQIWYGVNRPGPPGGDGNSNDIGTRQQLQAFDPALYAFLSKYINQRVDIPVCF